MKIFATFVGAFCERPQTTNWRPYGVTVAMAMISQKHTKIFLYFQKYY